ncbi:class D sortase [Ferroacidibacillus organovorans]|uniref:Sortase n=1 Tax=Ferroacidibacillus organovorans TaxID=1765683 RepID=A0A853K7K7_9BACL|nr:class D sortase [Ferroacidibacillus organovorans]KYP79603.1 hypothetical protein AYJ22_14070 [Ferroacidibacillus organovorans]OAG91657.1 hypothetical protein AYW79_13630 [Ferroacidibacillus organovorans]
MQPRAFMRLAGASLIVVGTGWLAQIPLWFANARAAGQSQLRQEEQALARQARNPSLAPSSMVYVPRASATTLQFMQLSDIVAPNEPTPAPGSGIGLIRIPTLSLTAPIVQGTADVDLQRAVGHLPNSALPGQIGRGVLAAHNATWFRHINHLRVGDVLIVNTMYGQFIYRVTGHQIVRTGTALANSASPEIVLETCYPLGALYLTPYRYLVKAQLVSGKLFHQSPPIVRGTPGNIPWRPAVPLALWRTGLTLATNSIPMGNLRYSGSPALVWSESNSPLDAANALEELFAGWLHASALKQQPWLSAMGTKALGLNPFWGIPVSRVSYARSFQVRLTASGIRLDQATANVTARINGQLYNISMLALPASGSRLKLQTIDIHYGG